MAKISQDLLGRWHCRTHITRLGGVVIVSYVPVSRLLVEMGEDMVSPGYQAFIRCLWS